jgi:hypothetical protein
MSWQHMCTGQGDGERDLALAVRASALKAGNQLAALLELVGRGSGLLEAVQLCDMGA